jgi:hypothetical protein
MKHLNWVILFLLSAAGVFGQFQDPPPAHVVRYIESHKQLGAYDKWKADDYVYERYIACINRETKGVKWQFVDKYSNNGCYDRLAYLSTYLYKRRIGKARVCVSADSAVGIRLWMDLNRRKVRSLRDFVAIPNVFNHTLQIEKIAEYEKIAGKIGEQVYKDVIRDAPVEYNEFIIIYFRAKKRERSLCCIVVKEGERCIVKHSYFLPKPIY